MPRVVLDPGHVAGYNKGASAAMPRATAIVPLRPSTRRKATHGGLGCGGYAGKVTDNPNADGQGQGGQGADLFVSLHSNGVDNPTAYGVSTFYSIKRPGDAAHADRWCKQLAGLIRGGTKVRGPARARAAGTGIITP